MIWASVNRLFFIKNLLEHLAEKILLLKPLIRGEDYPYAYADVVSDVERAVVSIAAER